MNRQTAKELLPIIQAFADGETVQRSSNNKYFGDDENPEFFGSHFWRIKPEAFELWALIYLNDDGIEFVNGSANTEEMANEHQMDGFVRAVLLREVTE